MATTDIIFDEKRVDIKLAEEYIGNISLLHSIGFHGNGSCEIDVFKTEIRFADVDAEPIINYKITSHSSTLDKLLELAKLIEKNANLFCQLEYLIRGIPVEDVRKCDLKLIIDNLLYCYKTKRNVEAYNNVYCDRIALLADTPLAALGFIAQALCCGCVNKKKCITIISNTDTAVLGFLFVNLCHEVGLDEVLLKLVPRDADCSRYNILEIEEMATGCVGVVTGKSDVDSAVDAFLSTTARYPWRLSKIFVQECALERFKRALAWKSERQAPGSPGADAEVSCAASYRCGDKVFALEATGSGGARVVALEAYRTVRELLALLGALRPLAVSLWSSDVAESLEIAHGVEANIVWVNDFADFRGPPRVSQAFYSVVDVHCGTRTAECGAELDTIERVQKCWLLRDAELRRASLLKACEGQPFFTKMVEYDFQDRFARAAASLVVTSTITPARIWQIDSTSTSVDMSVMTFLMEGGGLLVKSVDAELNRLFQDILKIKDVPIVFEGSSKKQMTGNRAAKVLWKPCYRHKVIWTNYGTTFAN